MGTSWSSYWYGDDEVDAKDHHKVAGPMVVDRVDLVTGDDGGGDDNVDWTSGARNVGRASIIGPPRSGKTSLMRKLCEDAALTEYPGSTIGMDLMILRAVVSAHSGLTGVALPPQPVRLQVMDLIVRSRSFHARVHWRFAGENSLLVVSLADRDSWGTIADYMAEADAKVDFASVVFHVVGSQLDRIPSGERSGVVSEFNEAVNGAFEALASRSGLTEVKVSTVSCLSGDGIDKLREALVRQAYTHTPVEGDS